MFQQSSDTEYQDRSEGGTRHLFKIDGFEFVDVLDDENQLHHFVVEHGEEDQEPAIYETDRGTMYEFMARYLAGEYEKKEYKIERSPAHAALLDALEIALAGARSGETDFEFDDLDDTSFDFEAEGGEAEDRST